MVNSHNQQDCSNTAVIDCCGYEKYLCLYLIGQTVTVMVYSYNILGQDGARARAPPPPPPPPPPVDRGGGGGDHSGINDCTLKILRELARMNKLLLTNTNSNWPRQTPSPEGIDYFCGFLPINLIRVEGCSPSQYS